MTAVTATTALLVLLYFPYTFCATEEEIKGYVDILEDAKRVSVFAYMSIRFVPTFPGCLLHVMVLFLGPLTNLYLSASTLLQTSTSTRGWTIRTALHHVLVRENGLPDTPNLLTWPADKLRNLFVAPLTEELVYRGLLVPYLLQLGVPPSRCVWLAPLFFGFAHVHHGVSTWLSGAAPASRAAAATVFQFAYTSLFGAYCTYALLGTGDVTAIVACHSFCNFMGLPSFAFMRRGDRVWKRRRVVLMAYGIGIGGFVA
eukprot:CAMPEP_0182468324 /NCGR_PEP_ID=MMETSP1319-20130603/15315_1 /TAXON_ID=172717 /ORGANISM="Bolidomonas pacifica, Strain RCC208" /LENGTH=256 /DNA_ID=CAMNT_0024668509 /DNA_START=165 /DNA_END=932 /DNA_ORIENTATION=-